MTASRNRKGKGASKKNVVSNVRIVDAAEGTDGIYVDRMISSLKMSESQCRILLADTLDLPTATTEGFGSYGLDQVFATDDFGSMTQQFQLFRVRAIKFDIYDVAPNVAVLNLWGIWHDNYQSTSAPAYTRANVADLPDSRVLSAGTGQTTLYWVAHGTEEMGFQSTNSQGTVASRFGGLKYYIGSTGVANTKFTVAVHIVCDFRGRR